VQLEQELADLHGKQAALLFHLGLRLEPNWHCDHRQADSNCLILSDALNHNSMIEGIRQGGCERQIFVHSDMAHLEELLAAAGPDRPKLIAARACFGWTRISRRWEDLRSRRALRRDDLCRRGSRRRHVWSATAAASPSARASCTASIFWKELARAFGASWLYRRQCRHHRRGPFYAPGFISPPAAARDLLRGDRRDPAASKLELERDAIRTAPPASRRSLNAAGLPVMSNDTHIVPLFVGRSRHCKRACDLLLERNTISTSAD